MASKDIPLSSLKDNVITLSDIQKLSDAGYTNVRQIAFEKESVLLQLNGLNEAKVTKLMDKANNLIAECFKTGLQIEKERRETRKISTGCSSLDKLLNGGISLGSITEIFGESGSGKSQLCLSLSVTCQIPDCNSDVEGKALYVYTEADFPSGRLVDISKKYNLEENKVLTNVTTKRALSSEHMMQVFSECGQLLLKSTYDLLIVDSIMHLLILDYPHQDGIGKRQSKLLQLMKELVRLASQHNIGVLITNGVYLDLYVKGGNKQIPIKPYGGNVMEHLSNTRLFLRKNDRDFRVCKLWKSSNLPANSASLILTEFGIEDISDNCVRQEPRMSALGDNGTEGDVLPTDETELASLSGYASNSYEDVEEKLINDLQSELRGTIFKYMKKYQRVLNGVKEKEVEKFT